MEAFGRLPELVRQESLWPLTASGAVLLHLPAGLAQAESVD